MPLSTWFRLEFACDTKISMKSGTRIGQIVTTLETFWVVSLAALALAADSAETAVPPPRPLLPIPTAAQLEWQYDELRMFLHFGPNTFTDREWGAGDENPSVFNPARLDTGQWVQVAREAGFRTLILTAKHHDGFCLWPSRYTRHSVASSSWESGRGDVVKALAEAARTQGVKVGLYLSPWDRHEPTYGNENAYNGYYLGQLRELLTKYGPISEVWFDGAKGKDARDMNYDFHAFWSLVRQLQPGAVMFSDAGPDVRWIGNERGYAGETNWSTFDRSRVTIGKADVSYLNRGDPNGPDWVPGECDTSIRKGWFWHPAEQPKSLDDLLDVYFKSVGRNAVLLLNVPPDRKGRLDRADVARLMEFKNALDSIFTRNLALNKPAVADNVRGGSPDFAAARAADNDIQTYWCTDDGLLTGILELDLGGETEFNIVQLQEPIALGQRIKAYRVEALTAGAWKQVVRGTTIGHKRLDRIEPIKAVRVRLVVEDSRSTPLIAEFGLYLDDRSR